MVTTLASSASSPPVALPSSDALRTAGTLILLTRVIESDLRRLDPGDGLSLPEIGVLGQVDRGVDTPTTLARALRIDPARITRITDRLVALGLLAREGDPGDRRRCLLRLTDPGRGRVTRARTDVATIMQQLLAGLSEDERIGLTRGLEAARRVVESHEP